MAFPFKRILIINPFGIGDVLFTTPLISAIRSAVPSAKIGYLANARTAPVIGANPKIDKVFVYERDEFNAVYRRSRFEFWAKSKSLLNEIKKENFELAIDLSLNGNASFLMALIGIPHRVGFNYKNRSPFLTQKIPFAGYEGKHVVEYYLGLLEKLGISAHNGHMEITVSSEEKQWAEGIWKKHGFSSAHKVVGLVPGGGGSWGKDALYKRWPAEGYAKLADKIVEMSKAAIILMGDQKERDLCQKVAQMMHHPSIQLAGKTSVTQMAALSQKCRCVVVNDGGPLHVAVAAGTRTVSIFGPVDDAVYGPYPRENHIVVKANLACQPCYRRFRRAECSHVSCLNNLSVEDVFEKMKGIL